jgi:hypothetical protein
VRHPRLATVLLVTAALALASCGSSDSSDEADEGGGSATTSTPTPARPAESIVFNGQGNNLDAYDSQPPFATQRVVRTVADDPAGMDINAQICFFPDGSQRFVAGEDTGQKEGRTQGWGIFQLTGNTIGDLAATEVGKLVPTFQGSEDNAENYGCGFLADGRIVTTDVGNQAAGAGDGQLIVWFPPFDSFEVAYCKVDIAIATAQSIWVDDQDRVYVASARPPAFEGQTAGVWRYSDLPTGPDAAGGCGRTDGTGAPMADATTKEIFVAAGANDLSTPTGVAGGPNGHLFVSSVINGVINEYDAEGMFVQTVLRPPTGEVLGEKPFSTGTPLGIGIGPDGTLYYADIGIVISPTDGIGPGPQTGSVRRIVFRDGKPLAPETMASGLDFPDGIGILPAA